MAPRRCCCQRPGCVIDTDDFNRADAADLGPKWVDDGPGWSIATNRAAGTGVVIFDTPHPTPSESMVVSLLTIDEEVDDVYKLLLNVLDDENYHVATLTITGSATGTIALGKVVGGTYTLIRSLAIGSITGTSRRFGALISEKEFCASATNTVLSFVHAIGPPSLIPDGIYSGMDGARSESVVTVDDFVFAHHSETKAGCSTCVCPCETSYLPPTLTATLTGTGRMSGLSCSFQINWDRTLGNWTGGATCCGQPFTLNLYCPDGGAVLDYTIELVGCTDSDVIGTVGVDGYIGAGERSTNEGTCDPIYLKFGPFYVSSSDLVCACGFDFFNDGTFILEITE
jgi:hypothetical protein